MSKRTYLALITEEGKATKMEELEEEGKATTMKDAKAQRKAKQMEVKALTDQIKELNQEEGPKRVYRPKWAETAEMIVRLGPKSDIITCLIGDTWEDFKGQACAVFEIDDPDKYDMFCAPGHNTIGFEMVGRFLFNAVRVCVCVWTFRFALVGPHFLLGWGRVCVWCWQFVFFCWFSLLSLFIAGVVWLVRGGRHFFCIVGRVHMFYMQKLPPPKKSAKEKKREAVVSELCVWEGFFSLRECKAPKPEESSSSSSSDDEKKADKK